MTDGRPETLWITDAELIRRSGVPERKMRAFLRHADERRGTGFPRKNPMFDNRRYWPAVLEYWAKTSGISRESA